MGGKLTIMARFEDDSKIALKMSTNELSMRFNAIDLFTAEGFKALVDTERYKSMPATTCIEHDTYEGYKTAFAPYYYGLLLFDYKEKRIFASNDMCGFLELSSRLIKGDYLMDRDDDISFAHSSFPLVDAIRMSADITLNGEPFEFQEGSLNDFRAKMYGLDLQALSFDDYQVHKKAEMAKARPYYTHEMSDVQITLPGWVVTHGDGSVQYVKPIFEYCQEQGMLEPLDVECWENYLAQRVKSDGE
ncbi:hypothetical protein YA0089_14300 [Pseudomonas viridiflava]|uniref:hypothetical protein n=1 Tax=Pseudomonas viridiflava TaxID=33069 RepID=UPI0018E5D4F0|nr:hypothetical protein [Pseudomonas viridiflava]MBI6724790.1 hypothetical protein [Pseudomonas viridiflava]